MVVKFWENLRTTSTETFTVVLIRPDCVYGFPKDLNKDEIYLLFKFKTKTFSR